MDWRDRISFDQNVCHGKPCIKGTRVMVSVIVDSVAGGEDWEELMQSYHIDRNDIVAALFYASSLTKDRVLSIPPAAHA
jgi:uncharacterized protein (DUF433 family)